MILASGASHGFSYHVVPEWAGADTNRGRILFHSALAIVRILFEGGYYSTCGYYSRKYGTCIIAHITKELQEGSCIITHLDCFWPHPHALNHVIPSLGFNTHASMARYGTVLNSSVNRNRARTMKIRACPTTLAAARWQCRHTNTQSAVAIVNVYSMQNS